MQRIQRGPPRKGAPAGARIPAGRRVFPSPYITLSCDHLTTVDEQEFWRVFQPRRGLFYCEHHCKWLPVKPKAPRPPLPDEPMF